MNEITLEKLLELHEGILAQSGGAPGVRDMNAIESALAQPQMTFGDDELYPMSMEISESATTRWSIFSA